MCRSRGAVAKRSQSNPRTASRSCSYSICFGEYATRNWLRHSSCSRASLRKRCACPVNVESNPSFGIRLPARRRQGIVVPDCFPKPFWIRTDTLGSLPKVSVSLACRMWTESSRPRSTPMCRRLGFQPQNHSRLNWRFVPTLWGVSPKCRSPCAAPHIA